MIEEELGRWLERKVEEDMKSGINEREEVLARNRALRTGAIVVQVALDKGAKLPERRTLGAAGFDLSSMREFVLEPGARLKVGTGVRLEIPIGYEGQVRSRSGLAADFGVVVLNSPGTIDSDYRGEVQVLLWNTSGQAWRCSAGQRIAQLVFARVTPVIFDEGLGLSETDRGEGGFGSTGQ